MWILRFLDWFKGSHFWGKQIYHIKVWVDNRAKPIESLSYEVTPPALLSKMNGGKVVRFEATPIN